MRHSAGRCSCARVRGPGGGPEQEHGKLSNKRSYRSKAFAAYWCATTIDDSRSGEEEANAGLGALLRRAAARRRR